MDYRSQPLAIPGSSTSSSKASSMSASPSSSFHSPCSSSAASCLDLQTTQTAKRTNIPANTKSLSLIAEVKLGESQPPVPWCDEVEKMVSGMCFCGSLCPSLMVYRLEILRHLTQFNDTSIPDGATMELLKTRRMAIAKKILGQLGSNVNIHAPFFVGCGFNLFLGDQVYINRDVSIYNNAPISIGARALIGPGVMLCTDTHEVDPLARKEKGGSFAKPIRIGDDCWIGARATILGGVSIGNGAVVAAGAVVAKDVNAFCVVGGVPARFIRKVE